MPQVLDRLDTLLEQDKDPDEDDKRNLVNQLALERTNLWKAKKVLKEKQHQQKIQKRKDVRV